MTKQLIAFVILTFSVSVALASGPVKKIKANLEKSSIGWNAEKVTGKHNGSVNLISAEIHLDEKGALAGGEFDVDMTSIKVLDMEGEWGEKLEKHLKSEDFFGAEEHSKAEFVITKVFPSEKPGHYSVVGDMTIRGITKETSFQARVSTKDGQTFAKAVVTIDRSQHNVKYRSASFFDGLGDKMIYDEFKLHVFLQFPSE